jgi:hypothetical protein
MHECMHTFLQHMFSVFAQIRWLLSNILQSVLLKILPKNLLLSQLNLVHATNSAASSFTLTEVTFHIQS